MAKSRSGIRLYASAVFVKSKEVSKLALNEKLDGGILTVRVIGGLHE